LKVLERVMGIEPTLFAWEARVLPLNDTRSGCDSSAINALIGPRRQSRRSWAGALRRDAAAMPNKPSAMANTEGASGTDAT